MTASASHLDPSLLARILSQLPVQDVCNASAVCKSWRDAARGQGYTLRLVFPFHKSAVTSLARLPLQFSKVR